jgi:predicted metal-dependent hydrolase
MGMKMISYTLIRQKRRTIAVGVSDFGEVMVKAPDWVGKPEIDKFLFQKESWLQKRLDHVRENTNAVNTLFSKGKILYLGGMLSVEKKPRVRARVASNVLLVNSLEPIEKQVYSVLKKEARTVIQDLINELEPSMKVLVKSFRLKDNSTNWGSCSARGNLNFNWRVVMAPLEVLRYLVIHEMSHLKHMDHSDRFWNFVAEFDTDWEMHDKWLKDNGSVLRVV